MRIARIAGAPVDKGAGMMIPVRRGDSVRKGDILFTIHAQNVQKLSFAVDEFKRIHDVITLI